MRWLPIVLLLTLLGCSTMQTGIDYDPEIDFSGLRSFGLLPAEHEGEDLRVSPLADRHTEIAIHRELTTRGYRHIGPEEEARVDFLVTYHNDVKQEERLENYSVGVGVGTGYYGSGWGVGTSWHAPVHTNTRVFLKGTLVIDIISVAEERLVWRGWAEDTIDANTEVRAKIDAAVASILERFPPPVER